MAAASIFLVDDHAVIAAPLAMALEASGFGPVVAAATDDLSPEAVLATARELRPDIVLLDLHLGAGHSGHPLVAPLAELGAAVVLFTASQDPLVVAPALRAGAVAVIDKAISFDRLVTALRELASTGHLLTVDERDELLRLLGEHEADQAERHRPFARLTPREAEVLRSLIDGRSPKEIARSASASVSTIRGHIQGVLTKLDVSSQREALALARTAGWPPPDPSS
jgi:DNA-binding NarL/FixJ family response regulator